jgi:glycerol-3-phosphate dehydrogenase
MRELQLDAVIFGGGAAGLWLLDELVRGGRQVLLLEAGALGGGQTIASQGILHGGMKYALQGRLTSSAAGVRDMPLIWRDCLQGAAQPDLSRVRVRAQCCHLWRTDSVRSKLGMLGARVGLKVAPEVVPRGARPPALTACPGVVARLDEQVISPASFTGELAARHRSRILQIDTDDGLDFRISHAGEVRALRLIAPGSGDELQLAPSHVVFTAGGGNAELRRRVGLSDPAMQRRGLHMIMLRGNLPELNGHCIDATQTRVTITSDVDSDGRHVWQVGGQVAEVGVRLDEGALLDHASAELVASIPGLDLTGIEAATYRVDRAERSMPGNRRPDGVQVLQEGNVITAWPTKLVLAPQLAAEVAALIPRSGVRPLDERADELAAWPRPEAALPPWEVCRCWHALEVGRQRRRAA